jgi:uncharacterized protein (DUF488 family)
VSASKRPPPELRTVGHGTLGAGELADLVRNAGIELVVDVRRFPGSRRHPQFGRDELARWLPEAGVAYRWEERLGGRRRGASDSPNVALRNSSFRAYADYMATPEFATALDELLATASEQRTAVMCAETLWWRCHRRLVADAAVLLRDVSVSHLMHDGSERAHGVTEGAHVRDGILVYDAGDPRLL